jgi:membrane associated rhomboid family serine protease
MNLADEIKLSFRKGNTLFRLIYINVAVFVLAGLIFVCYRLFTPGISLDELRAHYTDNVLKYLMVPSVPGDLLYRPWTLVTYMFTHFNFLHILFNMLMLFWFGRIFLQYLTGQQLLSTYLIGGLAGAALYMIFLNGFPGLQENLGSSMLGASAAIMAVVIAISFYVPDYTLYMLFIGPVKLKYIALFFIILDVLMIASYNAGGHIAHLGGAIYGYWFISRYKKGRDAGKWLNTLLSKLQSLFRPRPKLSITYRKGAKTVSDHEYNKNKNYQQKEIDHILDKIAKAGYDSLTKQEKEILFSMSDKKK